MEYNEKTALVVVDVQNDFASPGGSLYVRGGEEVISYINGQIGRAMESGGLIVYTQDWHPESTPHFEKDGGIWPVHCVAGTEGAEFHPELYVVDDSIKIKKGVEGEDGYSAFHIRDPETGETSSTGLADRLSAEGVSSVVVLGLALDYCVKESVLDARTEGFETVLAADGTRPVNLRHGDGARTVASLVDAGVAIR